MRRTARAHLNRPVARVGHLEPDPLPPFVYPDHLLAQHERARQFFVRKPDRFLAPLGEDALGGQRKEGPVQREREVVVDGGAADRVVDGDEEDAVGEGAFDLHLVQERGDVLREARVSVGEWSATSWTHRLDVDTTEDLLACGEGRPGSARRLVRVARER